MVRLRRRSAAVLAYATGSASVWDLVAAPWQRYKPLPATEQPMAAAWAGENGRKPCLSQKRPDHLCYISPSASEPSQSSAARTPGGDWALGAAGSRMQGTGTVVGESGCWISSARGHGSRPDAHGRSWQLWRRPGPCLGTRTGREGLMSIEGDSLQSPAAAHRAGRRGVDRAPGHRRSRRRPRLGHLRHGRPRGIR